MATEKQIQANKENAKLGGVKTEEGKAVSRYNAIKHGLLSKEVLMDGEDSSRLETLEKRVREQFSPTTELEVILVDRIVANVWRLRRAMTIEQEEVIYISDFSKTMGLKGDADIFFRYEAMLERGLYKALHELQRFQTARRGEKTPLPVAVDVDVETHES